MTPKPPTTPNETETEDISKKPLSDEQRHTLEKNLDMLMIEYQMGESIGGKYFSYLYSCLNFTFIFYGASVAIFHGMTKVSDVDPVVLFWLFKYLLPISTYVLGLFYAYNSIVISRQGYYMISIEQSIISINKRLGFSHNLHGWDLLSKKMPSGFILPYGSMLMIYYLLPLASLILANQFTNRLYNLATINGLDITPILVTWIPWIGLIIYYAFMADLIFQMIKFHKLYNAQIDKPLLWYENKSESEIKE